MNQHTPGPWVVWDDSEPDDEKWVVDADRSDGTEQIAHVYGEANARLIEAAPRLLAALKEIIEAAPDEEPEYEDWGGDTERAENWGGAHGLWEAAQIARRALAGPPEVPA